MPAEYDRSDFGTEFMDVDQAFIFDTLGCKIAATYKRGSDSIAITVVKGDQITTYDDRVGVDLAIGDLGFWVRADALDFGSGVVLPKKHDQIITDNGDIYDVVDPGRMDAENILILVPVVRSSYTQP